MGKVRARNGARTEAGMKKTHPLSDLDAEIRDHLDRETRDNIERGMSPEERASRVAKVWQRHTAKEDTRTVGSIGWIDCVRNAVRAADDASQSRLHRGRGLVMALGIGANTRYSASE